MFSLLISLLNVLGDMRFQMIERKQNYPVNPSQVQKQVIHIYVYEATVQF